MDCTGAIDIVLCENLIDVNDSILAVQSDLQDFSDLFYSSLALVLGFLAWFLFFAIIKLFIYIFKQIIL